MINLETREQERKEMGGYKERERNFTYYILYLSLARSLHLERQREQKIVFALAGCNEAVEG